MFRVITMLLLLPLSLLAIDLEPCKHLLNRSSFGIDNKQLTACMEYIHYEDAVTALVYKSKSTRPDTTYRYRAEIIRPHKKMRDLSISERKTFQKRKRHSHIRLKKYYFEKMLKTEDPFLEKMVLFWHTHFTSSLKKVGQASLLYKQDQLFKKHALGNFAELLHAIIEDPAMLIYLDNRASKKGHPNENLARELLELFTLGEGAYSEKDIQSFARALTGYSLDRKFKFRFKKRVHDHGQKTFMGQRGHFNAHDIIDIILQQEATSLFIVEKLWLTFIGYAPNNKEVQRLAKLFRQNSYEMKPLMQALLTSPYFTDPGIRGTMIKSPIELVIGTLRSFQYDTFDSQSGIQYTRRLGQDLFDPPNVKGWAGGESWINTTTLLIRRGFLNRLTRGNAMKDLKLDLFTSVSKGQSIEERTVEILLPVKVFITPAPQFQQTLRTILQHPLYQLK